jgi:glycosyltransferase involved in cell wall biosynthesis|tara:strand:+ start:108 stop:1175 length:1068 start_codon:yes stop_codon:yes gene_type:complete
MKVYFPLLGFNRSGGVSIIVSIANYLSETGYYVSVGVPDYNSEIFYKLRKNVNVKVVPTVGGKFLGKLIYFGKQIMIIPQSTIVIATSYKTAYFIFISKLLFFWRKSRVIYIIQHYEPLSQVMFNDNYGRLFKRLAYYFAALTYHFGFEMVTVSSWIKEMIGNEGIKVIPNGINLNIYKNHPRDFNGKKRYVIGFNYRSAKWKGEKLYKKVYNELLLMDIYEIVIITSDETVNNYFPKAKCIYVENERDIVNFYRNCDIFLYLSSIEGFGLPPLEAMACGCVVLLTDSGGVMEYAFNDFNSLIVEYDKDYIINKLVNLTKNKTVMQKLSINAVNSSRNYSIDKMLKTYKEYIDIN